MKIIVLNHKMNLYYHQLNEYIKRINKINKNIIIAPSNIYLLEFLKKSHHQISSQDICYIEEGNHTGKVSWRQVKSLGIKYSLIGHSEKDDNLYKIKSKLKSCIINGITPILCFGNRTKEENIIDILKQINTYSDKIIYAYEPLYNISNKTIDIENIKDNINKIYEHLKKHNIKKPKIIYGGGINKKNINTIYNIDLLEGIMIGSKSSNIKILEQLLLKIDEK